MVRVLWSGFTVRVRVRVRMGVKQCKEFCSADT